MPIYFITSLYKWIFIGYIIEVTRLKSPHHESFDPDISLRQYPDSPLWEIVVKTTACLVHYSND